ncbi:MAG: SPOR domain-containing protein [Thermoanaerobaculum sp.]|nr:SPOR domain-containing protein [Thermoanaerobaculum sp.]
MVRSSAATRLSSWIGKLARGSAVLHYGEHKLVLHVDAGAITSVEGHDGDLLAASFGLPPEGDWFAEARTAVAQGLVTAEEAAAVLKRALTNQLKAFFLHPQGEVELYLGEPRPASGFVISYPHVLYELVLKEGGEDLVPVFLPNPRAVLRGLPGFSRWIGELALPEEALAILAKVNDVRSAEAIAEPSPHGKELVFRLLAASVGAGLVEARSVPLDQLEVENGEVVASPPRKRRVWWWYLLALVLAASGVLLVVWSQLAPHPQQSGGPWGVAVGGACQPAELEQLYRLQAKDRENLRVVPFGVGGQPCYRLVWGSFASQQEAEAALQSLPASVLQKGFVPHAVLVGGSSP